MAAAPQNTMRKIARIFGAPPALADAAPSKSKPANEAVTIIGATMACGAKIAAASGRPAPAAKLIADANAACEGCALVCSNIPNSS